MPRLNYVFTGVAGVLGALRARGWGALHRFSRGAGAAAGQGGLQLGGAQVSSWGGAATHRGPTGSRSLRPQELAGLCAGVGGVRGALWLRPDARQSQGCGSLYGGGEPGRGSRCGSRTVFASRGADSRGKRRRWRPGEEPGRSPGCECGREGELAGGTGSWPWAPGEGGTSVGVTAGREGRLPSQVGRRACGGGGPIMVRLCKGHRKLSGERLAGGVCGQGTCPLPRLSECLFPLA